MPRAYSQAFRQTPAILCFACPPMRAYPASIPAGSEDAGETLLLPLVRQWENSAHCFLLTSGGSHFFHRRELVFTSQSNAGF